MPAVSEYEIGNVAGEIWALLSKGDKLAVSQVLSRVDVPAGLIYMGIGWLAREGKLKFEKAPKRGVLLSLNFNY